MMDIVKRFDEISKRDDCFRHMVPSDIRQIIGEIRRLRARNAALAEALEEAEKHLLALAYEAWQNGETADTAYKEMQAIQENMKAALQAHKDETG